MPTITLNKSLLLAPAAQVYSVQATPPFAQHDRMMDIAASPGYQLNGVRIVPEAGILILEPHALLVPTPVSAWSFPDGLSWMQATDSATGQLALYQSNAAADLTFTAVSETPLPANAAFYARIGRGQPAPGATMDADHIYTTLSVGENTPPSASQGATPFRLTLEYGRPPFLQQAVPDPEGSDSWTWPNFGDNGVVSTTIARSEDLFDDVARVVNVEWLPAPSSNMLVVRLANGRDTLVFRPKQINPVLGAGLTYSPAPPIAVVSGALRVTGGNGVASIQYLPMRFAASGTLTSPQIALSFTLPAVWSLRTPNAQYNPATQTVDGALAVADSTGRLIQYAVTLTSTPDSSGLAVQSPIVSEVQIDIPATYVTVGGPAPLDISDRIAEIEEHQWFDSQTLTVHTEVGINLDNSSGLFPLLGSAHVAAQYSRGLVVDGVSWPIFTLATGWAGFKTTLSRADPSRRFDLVVTDKSWQMRRTPVGAQPYFDGWCFLAAIRFLANVAGITDCYLGDPLTACDFGANPANCPHTKLAKTPGAASQMRFPPTDNVWDAIAEIGGYVGWVIGFDASGVLRTAQQTSLLTSTPMRGTFGADDIASATDPRFLMTIRDRLSVELDTSERRTGIALYGLGARGEPTTAAVLNVDDAMPLFVRDIHGFREPRVESANMLSDPVFAAQFGAATMARLILPQYTAEFGSYFLPAIFPLDQCNLTEDVMIGGTVRMNVTDISQTWDAVNPSAFRCRIKGRLQ